MKKTIAEATLKALNSFFEEFDACKTRPNAVLMSETFFQAIKAEYPQYISGRNFVRGDELVRIILTKDEEGLVGLSFSLDTYHVLEYQ